jgi:hypothetical protein
MGMTVGDFPFAGAWENRRFERSSTDSSDRQEPKEAAELDNEPGGLSLDGKARA